MGLTLRELIFLPPEITDLAKATRAMATNHANSADFYRSLVRLSSWQGLAADTAAESMIAVAAQHDTHAEDLNSAAEAMDRCEADAESVANKVRDLLTYAAERPAVQINEDTNTVAPPDTSYLDKAAAQQVAEKVTAVQEQMTKVLAEGAVGDGELSQAIAKATGVPAASDSPKMLQDLLLPGLVPPSAPPPNHQRADDLRHSQQEDAFRKVFGRDPVSSSDWSTASSLDPHSYDPKFKGVPPEVKVVRIRPVPGQGVVRSSQFISDRDVTGFPPPSRDLGNNRGPTAHFDPEDTKVTTTIDYDNGIIVVRQNPSVVQNADGSTGDVRVGSPTGSVTQTADGAVRIKYDSGNPFAPGISRDPGGPMAGHLETVNGDLVFTPGIEGVQISGTRTNYPWMEVYQDMPDGSSHTVLIDAAAAGGALGPSTNLPFHHDVGTGGKAFAPFDTGGWNPRYDVPAPLPGTAFGPVTAPPSVPSLPTGGTAQF